MGACVRSSTFSTDLIWFDCWLLVCCVVRWLVGWLVGWLVNLLICWFVGSLVRWFVGSLAQRTEWKLPAERYFWRTEAAFGDANYAR